MKAIISRSLLVFFSMFVMLSVVPAVAHAQACRGGGAFSIPTWHQYLPKTSQANGCQLRTNNLGGEVVVLVLLGVFDIILFLAGFMAVLMIIYGGYKYLVSTGDPGRITAAKTTIQNAVIGLVIAVVASQIIGFIAGRLG